jgi:hypothetical protein
MCAEIVRLLAELESKNFVHDLDVLCVDFSLRIPYAYAYICRNSLVVSVPRA